MQKIIILALGGLSLLGCWETETAVKDEKQEQAVEAMLAGVAAITPNTVIAYPRWLNKDTLEIDFLAYKIQVKPVFGTAINLKYEPQVIEYSYYKEGDFLERGGAPTGNQKPTYLISPAGSSEAGKTELIIGGTLFRGTPGVTGSGKLLTLRFKVKQTTATVITITKGKLKSLQADDLTEVQWPDSIPISPLP